MIDRHFHEFPAGSFGLEIHRDVAIDQVRMAGEIVDLPPGDRVGAAEYLCRFMQAPALRLVARQRIGSDIVGDIGIVNGETLICDVHD